MTSIMYIDTFISVDSKLLLIIMVSLVCKLAIAYLIGV